MPFRGVGTGGFTAGDLKPYSGVISSLVGLVSPQPGWLLANGFAVSRIAYSELFSKIGIAYGAGDGSTTFNLPDSLDRILIAMGAVAFPTRGEKQGEKVVTLGVAEMPNHSHQYSQGGSENYGNAGAVSVLRNPGSVATVNAGGGGSHNNMPPYLVVGAMLVKY